MTEDVDTGQSIKVRVSGSTPRAVSSVQCSDCGAVFSRAEHLTRHKRSHTNERPFICSDCGKSFSRVDVLARHAASHHEDPPNPARDRLFPRACRECAESRVRCSRGEPCNRCSRKNLQCVYPTARKRRASEESAGRRTARRPGNLAIGVDNGNQDVDGTPLLQPAVPNSAPGAIPIAVEPTPEELPWVSEPANGNGSFEADGIRGFPETYGFGESVHMPDASMSAMNWLSPGDSMQFDWSSQLATGPGAFEALGFPFVADMDLSAEQVAWPPTPSVPDPQVARGAEAPPPSTYGTVQSPESTISPRNGGESEGVARSTDSSSSVGTFYVDGNPWRAPLKASPSRRRSTRTVLGREGIPSTSPSNGTTAEVGEGVLADAPPSRAYEAIVSKIKAEAPLWEGQKPDLTEYPSPSQMESFFKLYFRHFHQTLPFLRRDASFYELSCHWVLLLALCAIGSRYCPGGSGRDGSLLFDILGKVLSHRVSGFPFETPLHPWAASRQTTPDDEDPLSLLQAAVLNLIWKVHGGKEHAARGALAERHRIVAACTHMDLLGGLESEGAASGRRDWWEEQSRIRTGLAIWLLDSILEYEIGSQPLLRLGDIKVPLPCRERLREDPYAATTPQESSQTTTVHDAIESIYVEKKLPPSLSDFSVTILTHAVCRRATEAVCHYQTPLASWFPTATTQSRAGPSRPVEQTWPPSLPILSRWRNSACDGLDVLHVNTNSVIAKGWFWEPPAVFHLHLSRLLLLTPVAPLQVLASVPRQRVRGADAAAARGKVLRWAIDDQYKARLAIIHAGSLFWHVRRHSADSFLEPFGVFLATLVIWAYSTSVQFASRSLPGVQKQQQQAAQESAGGREEVEEDAEPPFVHLDRPIDDEAVQAYVKVGQRMSGYLSRVGDICKEGAPRKILREGRDLLLRRRRRDWGGSEGGGGGGGDGSFVWGVAAWYVETLECLIQSSGE